jgi:carbon starvation protein
MLQDTLGNLYKPVGDVNWKPGLWGTSAVVVLAWGYFLYVGVGDPLGGINQLFPLFGIANQLLAAIALTVCTTLLIKTGRARYAWVTGAPLAWDVAVTLTASWQKVFSTDPTLGFFAQRTRYAAAVEQGQVLAPAKNLGEMGTVVVNSTVDGVLSALFALLVVIVVANAMVVWYRALTSPDPLGSSEAPAVPSQIVAPSGLIATTEEKRALAAAGEPR